MGVPNSAGAMVAATSEGIRSLADHSGDLAKSLLCGSHGLSRASSLLGSEPRRRLRRLACSRGAGCPLRVDESHRREVVHPGDWTYRCGLVYFTNGQQPEFETLWQLFMFYNIEASGYLDRYGFRCAVRVCKTWGPQSPIRSSRLAWQHVQKTDSKFVSFRQFSDWADSVGVVQPLRSKTSCNIPSHVNVDCAETPEQWKPGFDGLVQVEDASLFDQLQQMLVDTHKKEDNWTRDRGCNIHGVNKCRFACAMRNRAPVPSSYTLVKAYRNQNFDLMRRYRMTTERIAEDCSYVNNDVEFDSESVESAFDLDHPLEGSCNEWRLFHGTSLEKARSICATNFRQNLAGTGHTLGKYNERRGVPLYGFGAYFAERITKSDEYAETSEATQGDPIAGEDLYCVLVCRVVGGRVHRVTTNAIEIERLKTENFMGPFDSVLGDRVSVLKKPFREIVVYDSDQIFPEFVLLYKRHYAEQSTGE